MTAVRSLLAWLTLAAAGQLLAEETETYELKPDLVVTPSRMIEPLRHALASVSVITRDDIERSAAGDLYELLRLQPGVDIVRTGGPGTQTSVFLRGSNSNHVLVLIDGVRVSSANTGAYAWELLPLNQVERVEIVRGPRGSLYGSDSIGGVIQVFTRSSPDPYARVTAGSFDTIEIEGGAGFRGARSHLALSAGYRNVGGYSAQNPNGFSYDADDDGIESSSLGLKGSADADYGSWHYSLLAIDTDSDFDQGVSRAQQQVTSLGFSGQFSPVWEFDLTAGYIRDELFSDFGFFTTDFDSSRWELNWQNRVVAGDGGEFVFGLDYQEEEGRSDGSWDRSRRNKGLFGLYDRSLERLHLQLAGRFDDNSRFGDRFTGQLAAGYDLGDRWRLTASYGSAFRGPNLSEQYSPGFGGLFAGNPDLDPESSVSAELGIRWRHGAAGQLSAALYRTDVEDLIAFNGADFQAVNIDEARLEGLELEYVLDRAAWRLDANLTLQDTENLATGADLLRRPERKASIRIDRQFENGSWMGLEWFYAGERDDFGGILLDSYQLVNLRAGWAFTPGWRLELRGENLTDESYEPAFGFDGAGRAWFLSLAWIPARR